MPDLFSNITTILGAGFLGLSFIMAYLAYNALKDVIAAPQPKASVVALAKTYMLICIGLLICAGPLQLALLWAQSTFGKPPVNVTISLASTQWQPESYGDVGIMRLGKFKPFSTAALTETFHDGEEINIQLDKVISSIQKMQAQILAISQGSARSSTVALPPPPPSDPAAAALTSG
jgi:hypothetical protein